MRVEVSAYRSALPLERIVAASLALVGCTLSLYLAIYQYGVIAHVWEPLFGNGSVGVLQSGLLDPLSRLLGFPIHDALLGAGAYGTEMVLALLPRTRPLAIAYCVVVLAMGLTGLALVILQGALLHAWCTLCLVSAAISEAIVILSTREFINLLPSHRIAMSSSKEM